MSFTSWGIGMQNSKSKGIWNNRKFGLGVQNEAGQSNRLLSREHTGRSKNSLPTTQETTLHMDITRWSILKSDRLSSSQPKMLRSSILSVKTSREADCGSDHRLLIPKFRLKLKKVGETTGPVRCDLNQIPYDYTVKVKVSQLRSTVCDPIDYTVH